MLATISRWGKTLALRLPQAALDAAGLREGDTVTISGEDGVLRIARSGGVDVHTLIASITPQTLHREDAWIGSPASNREAW
jgi:antitoxin component of MazEF toxin-antitoxin module